MLLLDAARGRLFMAYVVSAGFAQMASLVCGWLDLVSATDDEAATDRDGRGMSATDESHFLRVRPLCGAQTHGDRLGNTPKWAPSAPSARVIRAASHVGKLARTSALCKDQGRPQAVGALHIRGALPSQAGRSPLYKRRVLRTRMI